MSLLTLGACGDGAEGPDVRSDGGDGGPAETPFVRQEIHDLTAEQIDAYRQGVALMKSRPADDPTSWLYQANIHGVPSSASECPLTPGSETAWATCQHGQFFFLAWHRMYLYFFERILRDAVREATGDPQLAFALPYWDYENLAFGALPEPFRVPADGTNPLFVAQRASNCNAGQTCVSPSTGSATEALMRRPYCNCAQGQPSCDGCTPGLFPDDTFGGQLVPAAQHRGSFYGELEMQPHSVVHTAIGGFFGGWMSNPNCAARDPIFWVHHANIDRLWQVWLNQGGTRANPLGSATWKDETFTFFDVGGVEMTLTACEILNMATQLDYEYEGVPVNNVTLCEDGPEPPAGLEEPAEEPATPEMLASAEEAMALGVEPMQVRVEVPDELMERMAGLAETPDAPLKVVVEGLDMVQPGAFYQVYLNLPEEQEPDPASPYFLGNLALFAHPGPDDPHAGELTTRTFDIADNVRQLRERGEWEGDVRLTFVLGNREAVPEGALAEMPERFITFERVSVQHGGPAPKEE